MKNLFVNVGMIFLGLLLDSCASSSVEQINLRPLTEAEASELQQKMLADPHYQKFQQDFFAQHPEMQEVLKLAGVSSISQLKPGATYILETGNGSKTLRIIENSQDSTNAQFTGWVRIWGYSDLQSYYTFLLGSTRTDGQCIGLPISIPQVSANAYVYGPTWYSRTSYGSYSTSASVSIQNPPKGYYSLSGYHTNSCSGAFAYTYTYRTVLVQ